jgi:hypothetical protein
MAKQVIALEATLNSGPAEGSVKSLKAQLREAQQEVVKMSDKFGETSVQAAQAAQKAAQLKDRIGDAKALTEAFNPDKKFQAFSSAIQGVVGGFSALQGAQALFGAKSEDLEKTLVKVQGAMALSQGLSAITEAGDSFKNLKVVAVNALNSIKAAIGSTGIGLLVIALGAIYTYWDDIKGAVNGVSAEQDKLNAKTKANLDAQKQKLTTINSQDNILKLQGKTEKDILNLKISQYDAVIKATEAQIVQSEITKNAQIAAAQRNKEILKGLLNFLSIPITAILYAVDQVRNALGGTSTLLEDYKEGLAKMVFDPEQTKKDGEKEIQEQKNALQNLKNERAGFQLQIQAIDKDAADKAKAQKEKDDAEALKKQEEFQKKVEELIKKYNENKIVQDKITDDLILRNRLQNILDTNFKVQQEIEINRQNEIDKQLEAYNQGLLTEQQYNENKALINSYYDQQQLDATDKINFDLKTKNDKAAAEELKTAEDIAKAKIKLLQDVANATGALSDVIGKETAVGKGLAVAQATINTYLGASEVIKAKTILPEPLGTISKVVNVATIIATGLKAVKGILSTKVPGGGGGGGNPSLPSPSTIAPVQPQLGQTALNQQMINATGNAAVRAFVLETDVSGNQERIKRLNRAARIN